MTDTTQERPGPAEDEAPPVKNLYRSGYFPALRERWAELWRGVRWAAGDPSGAIVSFLPWLMGQIRRDWDFFQAVGRGIIGGVERGLRHRRWRRVVLGVAAVLGFLVTFSWERCGLMGCPPVSRLAAMQPGASARVYDARGNLLGDLAPVRWEVVDLDRLPKYVPEAFVAVEDQRFYAHGGVDWRRFAGAMLRNLKPGSRAQGASTITMQLARNVFPDRLPGSDRTPRRKVLEIRVAREIERKMSKRDILQTYLNHIYFGEGVYGIESAARVYFGKHARDLSLPEAALLAGLPKAPTSYNPRRNLDRSVGRRNLVLSLMAAQGRIGADQAGRAREARVRLARWTPERRRTRAPYYVEQVRRAVEAELGEELYTGGLKIYTPLDPALQAAAEQRLEAQLRRIEAGAFGKFGAPKRADYEGGAAETPYLQGAAMVMEAEDGDVKALVGGRSWEDSRFDRMTQGFRQPGSAFKPAVYAAAVEAGVTPVERVQDAPLRRELPGGEVWEPRNFDGRFRGAVTVRNSLRWSVNTAAVRLAERVGLGEVRSVARRMGITSEIPELPSVAIGASAVRPVEMVRAYSPLATLGDRVEPRWVSRVEDREGRVLWAPEPRRREALDPAVAFVVNSMLRGVVDRGTGLAVREAGFRGPAAGKTGTTNGATDAWFVGVTPRHVAAVWIGFDRPRPIVAEGSGGKLAAPVWAGIMRAAGPAGEAWEPPAGVSVRQVIAATGQPLSPGCRSDRETYREYFVRGTVPAEVCPRGAARGEGGLGGWVDRKLAELETQAREWAAEAWEDAKQRVLEGIGIGPRRAPPEGEEAEPRTERRPGREEAEPAAEAEEPGPREVPAAEEEPVVEEPPPPEGPSGRGRGEPADTIRIPVREPLGRPVEEPESPAAPEDTIRIGPE